MDVGLEATMQDLLFCRVDCPTCGTQHVDAGCHAHFNHDVHVCMQCKGRFESAVHCVGVANAPVTPARVSHECGPSWWSHRVLGVVVPPAKPCQRVG